jgi:cell fate regulator YaaT (PSP1 superfamily)
MTNMPAMREETPEVTRRVIGVRFMKVGKLHHYDFAEFPDLKPGEYVIVQTVRGRQMGQIMGFAPQEPGQSYPAIMRPASARDMTLRQEWESHQPVALDICLQMAARFPAMRDVKFIAANYNYDGSLLTFYCSADEKIDTHRFKHSLQREFQGSQVEIRQIGPRDAAKMIGGAGACGIDRCCSTFLTDFSPVSIKMAKAQGISLNPAEITGMCGRLRCCLVYEYEQYVEARKELPKRNKRVGTPFGDGKVQDVFPMTETVSVWIEGTGLKMVKKDDLVPLDELKALAKAAKEPCSKHGEGSCDCGKPKGQRRADQVPPLQEEDFEEEDDE